MTVYSKPDCHLCEEAMAALRALQAELAFELEERDITAEEASTAPISSGSPWSRSTARSCANTSLDEALLRERLESRR